MARYLHSIACILPPDILERVILEGTPEQRRAALNTLSTDNAPRSLRAQNAIIRGKGAARWTPPSPRAARRCARSSTAATRRIPPARGSPGTRATGQPGTRPRTRPTTASEPPTPCTGTPSTATPSTTRACRSRATCTTAPATTTPSGTASQMIFGDGDGELFNRFTVSLDIMGHELTHGVTESRRSSPTHQQSGALNESDVRRVRLARQAVRARADGRRGRLADRCRVPSG